MTGANHLVGGTVFTGVFVSFWDKNIFANPWLLVATLFFSILADIDHTKSPLGKIFAFTQLPQYLNRQFGHRTITHSLIVYIPLGLFICFVESFLSPIRDYTLIYFFAYGSHLIFDMMTVSGVPLLFPFKKNPCVLPGNREYRLKVKDLKSESLIFVIFLGIGLTCYPLMTNGFWTSYNRSFGTLEHLNREFVKSSDLLLCEYDYTDKGAIKKGKALVIQSSVSDAILFDSSIVFEVNKTMQIRNVEPSHTKKTRQEIEHYFYEIDLDSLQNLISSNIVLNAEIQCSHKIGLYHKSANYNNLLKLKNEFKPQIIVLKDSSKNSVINQIEIKQIELKEQLHQHDLETTEYNRITSEIRHLKNNYGTMSADDKENAVQRLKMLETKRLNFTYSDISTEKIKKQIEQLEKEIKEETKAQFTGKIHLMKW
jgi:inner membrane protein